MNKWIIMLAIFAAPGALFAETELKGNPEELRQFLHPVENTVTLAGAHEETAYSDKAVVSLVITTRADRLGDAMTANTRLRTTIAQSLLDAGVDADDINTSKFSSSPQFGWFGSKPKSFEVVNRMSVGITDEAHLQLIANLSDNNEEVVMAGMDFEHTTREEFQEMVKARALDKVMAQKARVEERLGVTLTAIGYNEQTPMPYMRRQAAAIEEISVVANQASSLASKAPPPQTFDEVEYQATVYVTFKIVQE